jgi:nucleotide-binding universal stress UspA family protein
LSVVRDLSSRSSVIVVGVDGSQASKDALRWAAQQAELTGATLNVVSAWHLPIAYGGGLSLPPDFDLQGDAQTVLDRAIDEVLGESPKVTVRTSVLEGSPTPVLLREAADADLLVVGSRGHGAFTGMLLGSVSEHCVSHSSCPVVVVRHTSAPA